ncbi:MAG: 4Fe-4S binding protein [Chloroflexi bacterium]|nr:4Fe-4S binding protein [Chloroflexota bacterium]
MAKGIIVYYSQTGNTRKIAESIHTGMSRRLQQADVARLQDVRLRDLAQYDLIGVGSPVWGGTGRPANVINFIEGMAFVEGKHAFAFCTHGALPGPYMARTVSALIQRGLTVIGWQDWYASVYLPYTPKPYYTDGHPDEIDLQQAADFGAEMAERSQRISLGETYLIPALPRGRAYDEIYGRVPRHFSPDFVKGKNVHLAINLAKCTRCGICEANCPTNCIDFSVSPPVFGLKCDQCWFCEQICPESAIEVDWGPVAIAEARSIKTLFPKLLELAEAQGRFRRLVPVEDVGWDTPFYKIVDRHPRLVIL